MAQAIDDPCEKESNKFLKVPPKSTRQIYLLFLIPAILNCAVYVVNFSADLVVAVQHFKERNPEWGLITMTFMFIPAFAYFVLTVTRPGWWMTEDDKQNKGGCLWFALQVVKLAAFPLFALYRYAGLIVLSVDATLLTGDKRKKTLETACAPAAIELYFFLQAWFQAAPQAVFQAHLLFNEADTIRTNQSVAVQILCIIMSVIVIAIKITSFQRYESQRMKGRKVPWATWFKKYKTQELENIEKKQLLNKPQTKEAQESVKNTEEKQEKVETPPLPPKNIKIIAPPTPLRVTTLTPLAVPDMPAPPRPDSIITVQEEGSMKGSTEKALDQVEDSAFIKINDVQETMKKPSFDYPSEYYTFGNLLCFSWWFLFILARVLSIAIFFKFFSWYLMAVIGVHYVIMISYLFYYSKYSDIMSLLINLWLGLVYIFGIIEYRVRLMYAERWMMFYYTFVISQNIFMTLSWYFYSEWEGLGYFFSFNLIFICMSLCVLSTIFYYTLLKPKGHKVYIT
ncbi:uncharacterized protein LOC106653987 [Trichogramma pretiosum]|uniref:uncharacterized protein LOC106653987 n=1 Tax=Trichogramma pretiosum TaxID=7493 RepID=UPI0006C9C9D7|nr:uncharacterized protein LOC106653987 [Trichogramma pretiosum]